ncbi:UvrD-helicase domain-containing protein [Candidatus Nitrospira salsa]
MIDSSTISDFSVRRLAESNFEQNVVVVAGAGTGKTTLLVNRLLSALLREPNPIPITKIVALTFTNKAATEMRMRLRDQLIDLVNWDQAESESALVHSQMLRYQESFRLSSNEIVARAQAALEDVEHAQIGTLHSFAAHLLRLNPLESGVPPNFHEDDGSRFNEYFTREWDAWIDDELGQSGTQHERWRTLLPRIPLGSFRELAFNLSLDTSSLDLLLEQTKSTEVSGRLREWFSSQRDCAKMLLTSYAAPKPRKVERALAVAEQVLTVLLEQGVDGVKTFGNTDKDLLSANLGKMPQGWLEEDFSNARALIRLAQSIFAVDHSLIHDLLETLIPFVANVQQQFINDGWITFQELLIRARALLRDYPAVRERLKHEYHAILVDEFQDTDPIQYEIVLYLCETRDACTSDWRSVQLTPGKLFIVGDPKQSIYTFRGADLEAFDHVLGKVLSDGGVVYELTTNFRSHGQILTVVNDVFDRLFQPREHIQPGNIPLTLFSYRHDMLHSPGVELRLVQTEEEQEDVDASTVTRLEAEQLARWMKEELLTGEVTIETAGTSGPVRPGHIGLLFRKLTQAHVYLEALQRHGIPYITDGEKHFYRRPEVIDLINVLRVLDQPGDAIGMLGILRSPIGGLNDREVYDLRQLNAFDCRDSAQLDRWEGSQKQTIKQLYGTLANLHEQAFLYPLGQALDLIFTRLPVLELAMASRHGEQAVANLQKIRSMAMDMEDRPSLTLSGFVKLLVTRLHEQPSEAERSLAEESLDAVRVLTIHKAKGLEFPIVILPGFHHGSQAGSDGPSVSCDWATEVVGVSIGSYTSLGRVLTKEKMRIKEEAEQRRLLYVAMTRARERLVLSGGALKRQAAGTFLRLLQEVTTDTVGSHDCEHLTLRSTSIPQTFIASSDAQEAKAGPMTYELTDPMTLEPWFQSWTVRDGAWKEHISSPTYLTPTSRKNFGAHMEKSEDIESRRRGRGTLVGSLTHRVLQQWDFSHNHHRLKRQVVEVCTRDILDDWEKERDDIQGEVYEMLKTFFSSPVYEVLQRATIVGREVPFTIPWDCVRNSEMAITDTTCVMEGVIDLVYELDQQIGIVDYKTDRIEEKDIPVRMRSYQEQAAIYKHAARQCLGLHEVQCQFIFLRLGQMVHV